MAQYLRKICFDFKQTPEPDYMYNLVVDQGRAHAFHLATITRFAAESLHSEAALLQAMSTRIEDDDDYEDNTATP